MEITARMVKELRERTGSGMMDCKKALAEAGGDIDKAVDVLRKSGMAAAAKRAGRAAAEGVVGSYIHAGGKIGVLVEVNCETDFVARTDDFQQLVKDISMHIAAADPRYVERGEVTEEMLAHEREIFHEQAIASGKPEQVVDRIVSGKMEKFFSEAVLLEQPFVKDADKTIGELVTEAAARMGENIKVRRFSRFLLGEGVERRSDDFAAEVRQQIGG
ncbi:MAG: translation elongation factor Ts [Acidobacteriota bacterium]|nr:translation elongation factor Ts [Acidobacteriota bacterium]